MITHQSSIYDGIEAEVPLDDRQGFPSSIHPIFADLFADLKPKTIIEVGSWKGVSACHFARLAGPEAHIYCVDTWLGGDDQMRDNLEYQFPRHRGYPTVYFQFLANVKRNGYHNQITPIPNTSAIGAILLKQSGIQADFIWIDGSHDGRDAHRDMTDYWPLVKPGGIIGLDDFSLFSGVYSAAWWFNETENLSRQMKLTQDKTIAWWKKPTL